MATYVIGDVQGCYQSLKALLTKLAFDESQDELWFVGDLVNRGPDSLSVLRFIKALTCSYKIVLGNHDLHVLAVFNEIRKPSKGDTLAEVLTAEDGLELIDWLRCQPLLYVDKKQKLALVHAGIAANWDVQTAIQKATTLHEKLQQDDYVETLKTIFSDRDSDLKNSASVLTRSRFCHLDGMPDYLSNGTLSSEKNLLPWYQCLLPEWSTYKVLFGHWAALNGESGCEHIIALDTGCVWGKRLTAYCIETAQITSVEAADDVKRYKL